MRLGPNHRHSLAVASSVQSENFLGLLLHLVGALVEGRKQWHHSTSPDILYTNRALYVPKVSMASTWLRIGLAPAPEMPRPRCSLHWERGWDAS